jgi:hypothetical protein
MQMYFNLGSLPWQGLKVSEIKLICSNGCLVRRLQRNRNMKRLVKRNYQLLLRCYVEATLVCVCLLFVINAIC